MPSAWPLALFAGGMLVPSLHIQSIPDPVSDGHQAFALDWMILAGVLILASLLWQLVRSLRQKNRQHQHG
jgi:hypothetical protein